MDLKIVVLVKCEVIHGKYNALKVTKCLSRNVFVRTSIKETTASVNSFVVWDVGV